MINRNSLEKFHVKYKAAKYLCKKQGVIFHLEEPRSWIISAEMNQFAAVHNFGAALRDDASGGDGGGGLRGVHHFLGQRWTTMYVKD